MVDIELYAQDIIVNRLRKQHSIGILSQTKTTLHCVKTRMCIVFKNVSVFIRELAGTCKFKVGFENVGGKNQLTIDSSILKIFAIFFLWPLSHHLFNF